MTMKKAAGCALLAGMTLAFTTTARADLVLPFEETVVVTGREMTCAFALKELNEIVKRATGKTFKAKVEGEPRTAHRIFLGRSAEAENILGAAFFDSLAEEESCVFAKGGDLFLVGGEAGTLWAVYDFVEDNLGYRWYQLCRDDLREQNEIVERRPTVVWKGEKTRRKPGFSGFRRDHQNHPKFNLFRVRHRSNTEIEKFVPNYRFQYVWRTDGHGYDMYLPRTKRVFGFWPEKVKALAPAFEKHPEWFSLGKDGKRSGRMQLCLSSPATRDALWQSLQWWAEKCGKGVYMIGSNDDYGGTYCYCRDCLALDKRYGQAGALWDCIIDLCGRLKNAGMNDVFITSLAYRGQTQLCPLNVTFPDNFVCDYAPVTWDRTLSEVKDEVLPNGRVYSWLGNCRDWGKACPGGLSYWYYGSCSCAYSWPRLSKELREIYEAGVRGAGLCGIEGGMEFMDLMHHMWFWCLYYPTGDARAEFLRACRAKYGPAAEDVLAYTDALESIRQRVIKVVECGPTGLDVFRFTTDEDLAGLNAILERAAAKTRGTKYEENASWARITLDARLALKNRDQDAEARARAASDSYCRKVGGPKVLMPFNTIADKLDVMANYAFLKDDTLPSELQKYPKERVTRLLPPKAGPFCPWGYPQKGFVSSVSDPQAACGFAISDKLPEKCAPGGGRELTVGLRSHNLRRYHIPNKLFPKGFWEKDKYKLFCLGRSAYSLRPMINWGDVHGFAPSTTMPIYTSLLSRLYDPVDVDRQYETWISVKAQGPKFFPGDTRENRIFIEQLFSVDLKGLKE